MFRVLVLAAALLLVSAKRPPSVDYVLGVTPQAVGSPVLDVEIRLLGDADGETRLELPERFNDTRGASRYLSDLSVKGARVETPDPGHRILRHKPGAKLTIRYRVQSAYDHDPTRAEPRPTLGPLIRPDWMALMGELVFAIPEGGEGLPATFRWRALPKGWQAASDLDHGAQGRPMTVGDVQQSITLAGARLQSVERTIPGGTLRFVMPPAAGFAPETIADDIAKVITAQRGFWRDLDGPYIATIIPLTPEPDHHSLVGNGRYDGFVLFTTPGTDDLMRWTMAHEHTHAWIPHRIGTQPSGDAQKASVWLSEGFTDFFANRTMLRAGAASTDEVVGRMAATMKAYDDNPVRTATGARIVADFFKDRNVQNLPYQRGQLLALKWDEDIRRKTGGKADLTTAILRMRDHYQKFPPGQGPDVVTGLVSAVWVTAGLDIRPDIARYADGGQPIVLPDEMFDGCLQARVTVTPAFDAGFDAEGSFATRTVRGVRPRGPAWNSGLRNGMALDAWTYKAGDMTRQIELTLRPAGKKARPRKISYWPYGDATAETRKLQLTPGMTEAQRAACGRKMGGL